MSGRVRLILRFELWLKTVMCIGWSCLSSSVWLFGSDHKALSHSHCCGSCGCWAEARLYPSDRGVAAALQGVMEFPRTLHAVSLIGALICCVQGKFRFKKLCLVSRWIHGIKIVRVYGQTRIKSWIRLEVHTDCFIQKPFKRQDAVPNTLFWVARVGMLCSVHTDLTENRKCVKVINAYRI